MRKIPIVLQGGKTYVDNAGNPCLVTRESGVGENMLVRDIYGTEYFHRKDGRFRGEEDNAEFPRHLVRPLYSIGETYYTRGTSPVEVEKINDVSETYRINGNYVIDGRYYNDDTGHASDLMDYVGGFFTGEPAMALAPTPVEDVIAVAALQVESTAPIPVPCVDACTFCPGENSEGCCKNLNDAPVPSKSGYVFTSEDAASVWDAYRQSIPARLPTFGEIIAARAEIMSQIGEVIQCG